MNDLILLRRFVEEHEEQAFTQLVEEHIDFVYGSALRRTRGDARRAEEITQVVFITLARKASALCKHPALTGWLYTTTQFAARDLFRSEVRRHRRDQQAFAMDDHSTSSSTAADWEQIRPVIDDALGELSAPDRTAVLMRFFEGRPYNDIGAALSTSENNARMRVGRALTRLRAALATRGVASTAAALSGALQVSSAASAPLGVAAKVSSAALASATTGGTGAALLVGYFMTVKSVAITTTLISAVALGIIVHQYEENRSAASAVSALSAAQTRDRALIKDLEWRLAAAKERELKTELDHAPQTAVAAGAPSNAAPNAGPQPITRDQLEARLENARNLAQSGRYGEALSEYLWCYDTGTRQVEGYFMTRYSTLLQSLADLGRTYPAALDALRARRDAAKVRLLASATDMEAGKDFGQINRVLGEDSATQALFDALAEDDPRRGHIVESSIGRLLAAQRYHELAQAMPYSGWPQAWEEMTQSARAPAPNEAQALARRSDMIGVAAGQIEMRAGAGQLIEAGDAIERVLIFDSSPGTVSLLQEHLRRAGHPELLKL